MAEAQGTVCFTLKPKQASQKKNTVMKSPEVKKLRFCTGGYQSLLAEHFVIVLAKESK